MIWLKYITIHYFVNVVFVCFRSYLLSLSTEIIVVILQFLPLQTLIAIFVLKKYVVFFNKKINEPHLIILNCSPFNYTCCVHSFYYYKQNVAASWTLILKCVQLCAYIRFRNNPFWFTVLVRWSRYSFKGSVIVQKERKAIDLSMVVCVIFNNVFLKIFLRQGNESYTGLILDKPSVS